MRCKSPSLGLSLPRCRKCGRYWRPARGVVADAAYCRRCASERQAIAASRLGLKRIMDADLTGRFLLPRKFRVR